MLPHLHIYGYLEKKSFVKKIGRKKIGAPTPIHTHVRLKTDWPIVTKHNNLWGSACWISHTLCSTCNISFIFSFALAHNKWNFSVGETKKNIAKLARSSNGWKLSRWESYFQEKKVEMKGSGRGTPAPAWKRTQSHWMITLVMKKSFLLIYKLSTVDTYPLQI